MVFRNQVRKFSAIFKIPKLYYDQLFNNILGCAGISIPHYISIQQQETTTIDQK